MKAERKNIIIIAAAVVCCAAVVIYSLWPSVGREPEFTLPPAIVTPARTAPPADVSDLNVNSGNVISVLGKLNRVQAYIHPIRFTTYWNGGESAVTIHVAADGQRYRIVRLSGAERKTTVVDGYDYWIWYGEGEELYQGRLGDSRYLEETGELMQMTTYENIAEKPGFKVIDAEFADHEGMPCIYMEYIYGSGVEINSRIYISVDYGLVISEETRIMGELAFSMETISDDYDFLTITTPPESAFELPGVSQEET